MARRIKRNPVVHYAELRGGLSDNNDCGVVALMTLTEINYAEANALCAKHGRISGRGMDCFKLIKAIEEKGYTVHAVDPKTITQRYPEKYRQRRITSHHPDRFPRAWADGKNYLLFVSHHFLAVRNGITNDWSRNVSRKLNRLYEVTKK